jgi:hypothetical protein
MKMPLPTRVAMVGTLRFAHPTVRTPSHQPSPHRGEGVYRHLRHSTAMLLTVMVASRWAWGAA